MKGLLEGQVRDVLIAEYALATTMPTKKEYISKGNWIIRCMTCVDTIDLTTYGNNL